MTLLVLVVFVVVLVVYIIALYNGLVRAATRSRTPGVKLTSSSNDGTT